MANYFVTDDNGQAIEIRSESAPAGAGSGEASGVTLYGLDGGPGGTLRPLLVDAQGRPLVAGAGSAGSPAGGVVSVQGVSGGQALPVSAAALPLPADAATQTTLAAILAAIQDQKPSDAFIAYFTAVNTDPNVFSSQPVVTPVHIEIHPQMAGTVQIELAGGITGHALQWDDATGHHKPYATFYCANLNQLQYQFTQTTGGTQSFTVIAGI